MKLTRRETLLAGLAGSVATGVSACAETITGQFNHGVASGDPAADGFVIWTRVTPPAGESVSVDWDVAEDAAFQTVVKTGRSRAVKTSDWTVKIELRGLAPGQSYYYRFRSGEALSPTGHSKTLPEGGVARANFAVVSCSNFPFGFFNVYDDIAGRKDLDAVIHLGDYIYEYGEGGYGGSTGKAIGRVHEPAHEILTLADYRLRHGQYKSDRAAQAMHGAHSFIAIWDDHETANNSWEGGAENHGLDEGTWDARRAAALQAYYEWMPVREPKPGTAKEALFKSYQWGDLLTLATLETRLMARMEPLEYAVVGKTFTSAEAIDKFKTVDLTAESREMLGAAQIKFLTSVMNASVKSGTTWRMLANQIIMAHVMAPDLTPIENAPSVLEVEKQLPQIRDFINLSKLDLPLNTDAWDGYPAARERFYQAMSDVGVRDLLVLTGDTHEYWANDLRRQDGTKMGVELGTAGVTSPGSSVYFGQEAARYSEMLNARNTDIRYHDPFQKGYIVLRLTQDKADAEYVTVDTVTEPAYTAKVEKSFGIMRKGGSLEFDGV